MKTADTYLTWAGAQEFFSERIIKRDYVYGLTEHYLAELLYVQIGGSLYNLNIIKNNDRYIVTSREPLKDTIYEYAKEVTRKSHT